VEGEGSAVPQQSAHCRAVPSLPNRENNADRHPRDVPFSVCEVHVQNPIPWHDALSRSSWKCVSRAELTTQGGLLVQEVSAKFERLVLGFIEAKCSSK